MTSYEHNFFCLYFQNSIGELEPKILSNCAFFFVSLSKKRIMNPNKGLYFKKRIVSLSKKRIVFQESDDFAFPRKFVTNVGVETDGVVSMVSSIHQAMNCLSRSADVTELGASECHATYIMMGMERTSIDISVPLRTEFDLNEGLIITNNVSIICFGKRSQLE